MAIHIGKKIKEEVYRQRIPITDFAKKISRSRNVVYNIFERASVDTLLLNKIGRVLNCDFFSLYSAQKEYSQEGIKSFNIVNEPETVYMKVTEEMALLKQQVEFVTKQNTEYKEIIAKLLENKKPAKKAARKK